MTWKWIATLVAAGWSSGAAPAEGGGPDAALAGEENSSPMVPSDAEGLGEAELSILVADEVDRPVPGAAVRLEGQLLGRTGPAGDLEVRLPAPSLEAQAVLEVDHPSYALGRVHVGRPEGEVRVALIGAFSLELKVVSPEQAPLPGAAARVTVPVGGGWERAELASGEADGAGVVRLERLPASPLELSVTAPGHARSFSRLLARPAETLRRTIALAPAALLTVRAFHEDGRAFEGASVSAGFYERTDREPPQNWTSSSGPDGVAALDGVPLEARRIELTVKAEGFVPANKVILLGTSPPDPPSPFAAGFLRAALAEGERGPVFEVSVVLPRAAALLVRIVDSQGRDYDGSVLVQRVELDPGSFLGRVCSKRSVAVRKDQRALVSPLPPGVELRVTASVHGAPLGLVEGVVLEPGEPRELDVELPPLVPVTVRVEDASDPVQGAVVRLAALDGRQGIPTGELGARWIAEALRFQATSGEDGAAALHVMPGSYDLGVWPSRSSRGALSERVEVGGPQELVVELPASGSLEGLLRTLTGEPLPGWEVIASGEDSTGEALTDAAGWFRIEGLRGRSYDLFASSPLCGYAVLVRRGVEPGRNDLEVEVGLARVAVELVDVESGEPVRGVIEVERERCEGESVVGRLRERGAPVLFSDEAGRRDLELLPGEWHFRARDGERISPRVRLAVPPAHQVTLRLFRVERAERGGVIRLR